MKNSKYEYFVEKNDLDKAFKISKEINILPIVSDINPNLLSSEWSDENEYQTFGFLSSFSLYERDIFLGGPVDKNLVSGFSKNKMSNSVLLNEMVFYELHSEFKEKILSRLFKKNGDKIIVGTSVQRQYYENRNKKIICEKIIKNLNYNEGLKIISKFNFPENIWSDSRESKHSGYSLTFYNVSLSFLVKKISNSNKETYEIANKIFQIISSFKSNDPVAVSRSSNHKLMGYEFICKKFTELKLKKLAKKTLDLWIDECQKKTQT